MPQNPSLVGANGLRRLLLLLLLLFLPPLLPVHTLCHHMSLLWGMRKEEEFLLAAWDTPLDGRLGGQRQTLLAQTLWQTKAGNFSWRRGEAWIIVIFFILLEAGGVGIGAHEFFPQRRTNKSFSLPCYPLFWQCHKMKEGQLIRKVYISIYSILFASLLRENCRYRSEKEGNTFGLSHEGTISTFSRFFLQPLPAADSFFSPFFRLQSQDWFFSSKKWGKGKGGAINFQANFLGEATATSDFPFSKKRRMQQTIYWVRIFIPGISFFQIRSSKK